MRVSSRPRDLIRRDDLLALETTYRSATRRPRDWAWVGVGIGGIAAASVLISVGEQRGWPVILAPILLLGGWTALVGSWLVVRRRNRKLRAVYQIHCPSCGAPLLEQTTTGGDIGDITAIATGKCAHCGGSVVDNAPPTRRSR